MATWNTVVEIGLALPGVEASSSYGTPALKVKGKLMARLKEDETSFVVFVADLDTKEAMLATEPEVYFTTPHYDGHAAVLVRLAKVKRAVLGELLKEAHGLALAKTKKRSRAPAKR